MAVKLAEIHDVDAIVSLVFGFMEFLDWPLPSEAALKKGTLGLMASDDVDFILLFNENDEAIGYILQHYRYSQWTDGLNATLQALFVAPTKRQKGAAKLLMNFAIKRAKEINCKAIELDSNENNAATAKLYFGLGFATDSEKWNGGRQIVYSLAL